MIYAVSDIHRDYAKYIRLLQTIDFLAADALYILGNVAGLSTADAQKSSDMFAKCRYMDELTGGRGVVFATGTPISNSITEMYTLQRYLQYDRLQALNMTHFDCWASCFGETTTALELAPEGTGYRMRTRFSRFYNLPELMNLFKEVADIKTADQLDLRTPEVEFHTVVSKPTEHQKEMVQELSKRATKVHTQQVDPHVDNMLTITSDGRKLGLDQRILNPLLPDEPETKVNKCVQNVLQIWRDTEAEKLTQLVFCDISTPKNDGTFNVYDDIRAKLIAAGMPPEQIAYIHEANTDKQKQELFAKVRSGQVRVLLGSTEKMGAGTNIQDKLIASHDLDCPWRPRDLTQRLGRIKRQGNNNEKVHVYRYVTEGTFDSYLWQTIELKQKFISQIMTSKSPVRTCEDVDATALDYAEIKALCAGDPRIKERMELDVEVSRLKMLKAAHQSQQYRIEDQITRDFPQQIAQSKQRIEGYLSDIERRDANTQPNADGFSPMELFGKTYTDKKAAGSALLDACHSTTSPDAVRIGRYRGFVVGLSFNAFSEEYEITLRGMLHHSTTLGTDIYGNLTRIDNLLERMDEHLDLTRQQLESTEAQLQSAKAEAGKPFPQEEELRVKSARLAKLNAELQLHTHDAQAPATQPTSSAKKPSVLEKLKQPLPPPKQKKKSHDRGER